MEAERNKSIIQEVYVEAAKGNVEPLFEHMADDVRWTVSGTTKLSGTVVGKQNAIEQKLMPFLSVIEGPILLTATNIVAEGDFVVVQSQGRSTTKSGKPYDNSYCVVYRMQDGKMQEITEYLDTQLLAEVLAEQPPTDSTSHVGS